MNRDMTLLFLLAVAASMVALTIQKDSEVSPGKCCFFKGKGRHWSAIMSVLNTVNSNNVTVIYTQMNLDTKQQVLVNYTLGSKQPTGKSLIDYNKKVLYIVPVNHSESYCVKMPFNLPFSECLPDDAQYLGSGFLGPVAGNLPYDGWRYKPKPPKDDKSGIPPLNVVYTTAFSKEGCMPIVMGAHYPDGNIEDQLIMYSNFQPKLTDPSAFTLPKICFA